MSVEMNKKEQQQGKQPLLPKNEEAIGGIQDMQNYKCGKYTVDLPLIALCLLNFFLNAACSVITPFFPPLAGGNTKTFKDNPLKVSNGMIGMVIGIHPIGGFMFGLVVSKFMVQMGRKKIMLGSLITTVITLVMMGLCYHLRYHQDWFLVVALIARFFMGMARSGYGSTTFAYAPLLWPTQIPKMIGIMETATGLGLMFGPLIGAGLNSLFTDKGIGYQMVFYILSGLFLIMIVPGIKLLPKETPVHGKQQSLNMGNVMKRPHILALFFLLTNSSFALTYVYELWTNLMGYCYGVDENLATVYLTVATVTYITSLLSMPVLIKSTDKKFLLSVALIIAVLSTQLMSPATWIGFPRKEGVVVAGLLLSGASSGFAILPFIPELRENIMQIYPDPKFIHMVGDMSSGLFYAAYSFGTFLGPTVGGFIFDSYVGHDSTGDPGVKDYCIRHPQIQGCAFGYSFQLLSNMMTYASIFFFVMYMTFGKGYLGWIKTFSNQKQKQALPTHKQGQVDKPLIDKNAPTNNNEQNMSSTKEGMSDLVMTDSEAGEDHDFGKRNQKGQAGKPYISDQEQAKNKNKKKKDYDDDDEEDDISRSERGSFIM